jgi:hypothetical protein
MQTIDDTLDTRAAVRARLLAIQRELEAISKALHRLDHAEQE